MPEKKIIVVGGGFGGITAVLKLSARMRHPNYRIILVDKNPYQVYTPALYEIAAIPKEVQSALEMRSVIIFPFEYIVAGRPITFIQGTLTALDQNKKIITLADGQSLPYDTLVLAPGSVTGFFHIPGLQEHSFPIKSFEDAVRIRNKIEALFLEKRGPLTIAVGGGGSSGVELIAEFSNFICTLQKKIIPEHLLCDIRLMLVEASPDILPGFDKKTITRVRKKLITLGIEILTSAAITEVTTEQITMQGGATIHYDLLIWTGGVTGTPILSHLGLPTTTKGTIPVNEFLEAGENIFVIGDAACFHDPRTQRPLPGNIPVAEAEARHVVKNILRRIAGKEKIPFRPMKKYPFVLTVGKKYAAADLLVIRLSGFFGWCLKLLVELRYLMFILPWGNALKLWWKAVKLYSSND